MLAERLDDVVVACLTSERVEKNDGAVQFGIDIDRSDRDEGEPLVVEPDEIVGDDLAQRLADASASRVFLAGVAAASLCHVGILSCRFQMGSDPTETQV